MAVSLLTVLKTVPWGDVLSNAPKLADGARKLWQKMGSRPEPPAAQPVDADEPESEAAAWSKLNARVASLDTALARLQGDVLASSELITQLAAQNAGLIQHMQRQDRRLVWLTAAVVITAGLAVVALVWRV